MSQPPPVTNIAGYKFATLTDLQPLRERLRSACKGWGLRGTILLSTEGINLFLAGTEASVALLLEELRCIPGLEDLEVKRSQSDAQPFSRMLVRIKREIIAFGVPGIDPAKRTSPKLAAQTLRQWLDEGRDLVLLDTRNDYEVKLGTFRGAVPIGIHHFRDFPEAVRRLPDEWKHKPVVMFCTGGIRCEKAGPFMEREGFETILQLEGGILKYFEEVGGAHYDGECFVFDQRVGLDPQLAETHATQCFHCLAPLTESDQQSPRYRPGVCCPHCWQDPAQETAQRLQQRHAALLRVTTPLPGSIPGTNVRPLNVPAACDGWTVREMLLGLFPHVRPEQWEEMTALGHLQDAKERPLVLTDVVRAGQRLRRITPLTVEPDVSAAIRILHEDQALVVVDKPAPLPMHPCGRCQRNTLQHFLAQVYRPQKPRPAHRLDANTTGVAVLCRTRQFASLVQRQFSAGTVEKRYLARVQGHPEADQFTGDAPIGSAPGAAGSRGIDTAAGLAARTSFTVLERCSDGTALVEAVPHTGRTNQIRLHLRQAGHPVCGDRIYTPGEAPSGGAFSLGIGDPPLCLHAWELGFVHPLTRQPVRFAAPPPEWAQQHSRQVVGN